MPPGIPADIYTVIINEARRHGIRTVINLRGEMPSGSDALSREAAPGVIENVYRLQIMNTDERAHEFTISASGMPSRRRRSIRTWRWRIGESPSR